MHALSIPNTHLHYHIPQVRKKAIEKCNKQAAALVAALSAKTDATIAAIRAEAAAKQAKMEAEMNQRFEEMSKKFAQLEAAQELQREESQAAVAAVEVSVNVLQATVEELANHSDHRDDELQVGVCVHLFVSYFWYSSCCAFGTCMW